MAAPTTAPNTQRAVRFLWAVGWVLHLTKRARAARYGARKRRLGRCKAAAADPARRRRKRASANSVGWSASRVGRADNSAKPAARSACSVGGRLVLYMTKRARAARHGTRTRRRRHFEAAAADLARCLRQEPRPTGWGGARRELAAQTTAPSTQRAVRALWAVCWLSTRQGARAPRATGQERYGYDGSKPHPPTWCGVG